MKKHLLPALFLICISVQAQNLIDNYLSSSFALTQIADSTNQILEPRDLEFKPNTNELWIVNKGTSDGGTNVIIYNAGLPSQTTQYRKDSHSSHFMLYPTALAFSDIGEFGTSGESQNSNGGGTSTFMGPVLWSSDTNIFARVFQSNWSSGLPLGSHLDMLHQSPLSMGIAHDTIEAYWVFDGYNSDICKYDFVTNHGPGYENHDNGIIHRYTDIDVQMEPGIPSHLIKDKSTGWLYIVDTGHKKLFRVNTNTGAIVDTLITPGTAQETLDGYYEVNGIVQEPIDTYTTRPSGIALYHGRLIVGDYDNGDIHVYDITGASPVSLGVIATGQQGMEGLEIGTDGKIWFVNNATNKVYRIDPVPASYDAAITDITSPFVINGEKEFFSPAFDLCSPSVTPVATIMNTGYLGFSSASMYYSIDNGAPVVYTWMGNMLMPGQTASVTLPVSVLPSGKHKIAIWISLPNDSNQVNNRKEGSFRSFSPVMELPFLEGFDAVQFPPAGWDYVHFNPNSLMTRDGQTGGFGNSNGCVVMDNYTSYETQTGQSDYLMLPILDLGAASANTYFEFDVAYARFNSSYDRLQVKASTDCGNSWSVLYTKGGSALSTATATTSFFVPNAFQWRHEAVSLSSVAGNLEVMFMFEAISGSGNNVYIDNITIADASTGMNENTSRPVFNVFPNPASGSIQLSFNAMKPGVTTIQLFDTEGRTVKTESANLISGLNEITLDLSTLAKGIYTVQLSGVNGEFRKMISVN